MATAATDALKAAIAERGHELVPTVVASLRGAAEDYAGALERARGEVNTAGARLRDAASLPHLIRATLDRAGVGTPDLGTPEGPAWPINPTGSLMGRLDRLEREWQRATSTTTA